MRLLRPEQKLSWRSLPLLLLLLLGRALVARLLMLLLSRLPLPRLLKDLLMLIARLLARRTLALLLLMHRGLVCCDLGCGWLRMLSWTDMRGHALLSLGLHHTCLGADQNIDSQYAISPLFPRRK